jgi:hypothetical protein
MPIHQLPRIPRRVASTLHKVRKRMLRIVVLVEDLPAAPGTGDKGNVMVVCVLSAEEGDAGRAAD